MNDHGDAYREEAVELLAELEAALIELEETPEDRELVGRIFRAMHTIKGSGGMFGFDDIVAITHEAEAVFEYVRGGELSVTPRLIGLTLSVCDQVRKLVHGEPVDEKQSQEVVAGFREILDGLSEGTATSAPVVQEDGATDEAPDSGTTYRIRFRLDQDIFSTGTNPMLLLDELRDLGGCRVVAHIEEVPSLESLNPEYCYLYWDVLLTTTRGKDAIRDVFIFVEDKCDLKIDVLDDEGSLDDEETYKKLGEILVERGSLSAEDLNRTLGEQKRLGEVLVEKKLVPASAVESALEEQQAVRQARRQRQELASAFSIRVAAEKLDRLVDLVGELVTVQAQLSQYSTSREDPHLLIISEQVERLTADLRDNTMSIRMVPIGTMFSKFKRLVHDLSKELGKEAVMTTEGEETELDKTVIERLNDPLVHIIRNSIDHGIEVPSEREAAGKPRRGTIHLSAIHSGANVLIRIRDDGKGLNAERIRARAVEQGLVAPDAELPQEEIFDLIFGPGFSTAKEVTGVSGRGVGMDVVKRGIEALRGAVETTSQWGEGTTITLKLPLTLAIIDGLLVEIGQDFFVLPLSVVDECIELTARDVARAHGRHMVSIRGDLIPYIRLRELFQINGTRPAIEKIVIVEADGHRVGFVVDQVIGGHQTVIKSLGKAYEKAEEFSGATILGDGTVALILDIHKLIQTAHEMELLVEEQ